MEFIKKHRVSAVFGMIFGAVLYSMLMTQELTNTFDGLWSQNYHRADMHELTLGRWMLKYIDKLYLGVHADPVASLVTVALFVFGFVLVLELFDIRSKKTACLCMALWISSTLICNTLSYRMTSIGYGVAYVLAVLAVLCYADLDRTAESVVFGGIALGLSMACYQAYLGVFCIIAVFYFIDRCCKSESAIQLVRIVIRTVCTAVVGACVYLLSLSFMLRLNEAALSGYNGAGDITLSGLILGLPANIVKTYHYFAVYYLTDTLKINRTQYFGGMYVLLAVLACVLLWLAVCAWRKQKIRALLVLLAGACIPIACNAYMLLAGDKLELQMTAGLAMLPPLLMLTALSCIPKRRLRIVCAAFCALLIYGSSLQVYIDQEAMYEGRNACETLASQIITDLRDKDLLSENYEYYFVGRPSDNPYFYVSSSFEFANSYAQMGKFWVSGFCPQMSYQGIISKYMGFSINVHKEDYASMAEKYPIETAACFPNKDYITLLDNNIVLIKVSE